MGVAGVADGSAKASTRLAAVRGWVLKTRLDQRAPTREAVRAALSAARARGRAAGLWHPRKVWGVFEHDGGFYPLTVCPELRTLRSLDRLEDRLSGWIEMLQIGADVHSAHGLGVDLNPANFGREGESSALHYLDEEIYDGLAPRNFAGAIAARIPEEPGMDLDAWARWGRTLRARTRAGALSWEEIVDEIRAYPLSDRFEPSRAALAGAIGASDRAQRRGSRGRLTCVLADVHANLAALEAVLREARARGAGRFLFLGDAVGYGPEPAACIQMLAELPDLVAIRGNHDHAAAAGRLEFGMNRLARACAEWTRTALATVDVAWLASLPLDHAGEGWLAVHGAPKDPHRFLAYVYELTHEDNLRWLRERRIPLCFHGHTHVQLAHVDLPAGPTKLAGERTLELGGRHHWLVNPGSVGQPRDRDPRAAYGLWDPESGRFEARRVRYDVERTLRSLQRAGLPPELGHRLQAGI